MKENKIEVRVGLGECEEDDAPEYWNESMRVR